MTERTASTHSNSYDRYGGRRYEVAFAKPPMGYGQTDHDNFKSSPDTNLGNADNNQETKPSKGNGEKENPQDDIDTLKRQLDELRKTRQKLEEEAKNILDLCRDSYAARLAKDHGRYFGRFLKSDTRISGILRKIPALRKLFSAVNERIDDIRGEHGLKDDYEEALKVYAHAVLEKKTPETDSDKENIRASALVFLTEQDALLEDAICTKRQENSKKATRFSNWWVRQNGVIGNVKKIATVVGAGIVTGATIATGGLLLGIGTTLAAPVAGGLVGFGFAKHITDRRAKSFVDKDHQQTAAQKESDEAHQVKSEALSQKASEGELSINTAVNIITEESETRANEAMKRNRNRYKTLIGMGTLGARMGGIMVEGISNWFGGADSSSQKVLNQHTSSTKKSDVPTSSDTPETTQIYGNEFTVEPGHGLTHELQEFVQLNGKELTPDQAWKLHVDLVDRFGSYLDGVGTYQMGPGPYDIGISSPGYASLRPEVAEFIMNRIA